MLNKVQTMPAQTMFEKIWDAHVVRDMGDGRSLIYIDRHFIHEGTSRDAFDRLRGANQPVANRAATFAVIDHDPSTQLGRRWDTYPPARERIRAMQENCQHFGIDLIDVNDPRQGIVHVIASELGITLPGCTLVCGDSHTATNGGIGAWAWGIGTTEVARVLATQTLIQKKPKTMRVTFTGAMPLGVYSKDLVLYLIGKYGAAAGTGYAIEYAGPAVRGLEIESRLTICNMSIEFGARSGLIAPDDKTIEYLAGRPFSPTGALWERAVADWRELPSDADACFDRELDIDCSAVRPQVTWGTSPQEVMAIDECVPDPADVIDPVRRAPMANSFAYMGLKPGQSLEGLPIDYAFIGSCTNARLSDLEIAATVVRGRKVASSVKALVVPGSTQVKEAAQARGLHRIFIEAGFEWRESGCALCQNFGGDEVGPGERCMSTANRNFEGRQGPKARTHLASPAMVAAAALCGRIVDVRKLMN